MKVRRGLGVYHLGLTFLCYEGNGPGEDIHEVRQEVRVGGVVELLDVEHVVLSRGLGTGVTLNLITAPLLL